MNNAEIEKELKTLNDKFDSIKELITDNATTLARNICRHRRKIV